MGYDSKIVSGHVTGIIGMLHSSRYTSPALFSSFGNSIQKSVNYFLGHIKDAPV